MGRAGRCILRGGVGRYTLRGRTGCYIPRGAEGKALHFTLTMNKYRFADLKTRVYHGRGGAAHGGAAGQGAAGQNADGRVRQGHNRLSCPPGHHGRLS